MKKFSFELKKEDGKARLGKITTTHGEIETPVFMPVGTRASIKTLSPQEITTIDAKIILGNTYHLYLRPGTNIIKKHGGLHKFMKWDGPILTDSGGFQVFSLGFGLKTKKNDELVKIKEDGVEFRSHLDGSKHFFTPKSVIKMQKEIGANIMMTFDECAPANADHAYAKEAMDRTHRWAKECIEAHKKIKPLHGYEQALFGIVQGVTFEDLRIESAKYISSLDFDGIAIGGLAVGESEDARNQTLDIVEPHLPKDKPRYLMGVGFPQDILNAVERGIDMFDCVLPTRLARNGTAWTYKGKLNLLNSQFITDLRPVEKECDCYACQNFTRSYIAHLIREGEILGIRLTTLHNLRFMMRFMKDIRDAISAGKFLEFKKGFIRDFN
ncbi:tRNA guanosine(34) transglycosylase Tgt [candidate division WS5 bacterium]|uniref:Queuine tRNA-ribosyltransferase n=1 Tax=candidate division WS5 bacterium TaxID=2093353 RepID=A0A419DEE9_9BACT|nr:MAG: tRNA guanosine(34) transglycosylase Tgt [candidate division WS5 bacterium]